MIYLIFLSCVQEQTAEQETSNHKIETINDLSSPAEKVCTYKGAMGIGYSEYFFNDGFFVRDYFGSIQRNQFKREFGTWKLKENNREIDIHISHSCYVKGLGNYLTYHWYIAYEDYILIEEKVEQHETIDWSEYIKMFERYNSNHGNNIFTINVLKKSDYQIKKIDCIEEANIFIEKQKALYNDIKNWIEE